MARLRCVGPVRAAPPVFARARAVFAYDAASRGLILGFKHADKTHGALAFAQWMARAGSALLAEADLIVPVPLHRWRLFARRQTRRRYWPLVWRVQTGRCLLMRTRATPSQGRLSRRARLLNVRGDMLKGCWVLLVDDVYTTGATVEAVDVLTLARVVRPA
jgi:predicted amidophosphoribosyltransferase